MQTSKAEVLLPFVGVVARNQAGQISKVYTPAATRNDGAKIGEPRHTVITLDRQGNKISLSCRHFHCGADADEGTDCPATEQRGAPCYHVLAAIMATAREAGCAVRFYSKAPTVETGRLLHVIAGRAECWAHLSKKAAPRRAKEGEKVKTPWRGRARLALT
jgi:hypothetical protein